MRDELVAQSRGTRPVPELVERGLTERQAEVMVLAVHGRSNRATAEALGLSERTVQKHLERCYRTLGVSGRSDAADLVRSLIAESAATPELKRRGLDGHPPAQPPD
jgi:DNA-binding NarL/FixJ family response regulator